MELPCLRMSFGSFTVAATQLGVGNPLGQFSWRHPERADFAFRVGSTLQCVIEALHDRVTFWRHAPTSAQRVLLCIAPGDVSLPPVQAGALRRWDSSAPAGKSGLVWRETQSSLRSDGVLSVAELFAKTS
jgi:hypothetical protein